MFEHAMTTTNPPPATGTRSWNTAKISLLIVAALVVGVVGRGIASEGSESAFVRWLPWLDRTNVTLFFADGDAEYLVPVSRTVSKDEATPQALLDSLLAGPTDGSGLTTPIPADTTVNSVTQDGTSLTVDLGGGYSADAPFLTHEAVFQSLRSWPGVEDVFISVDGVPLDTNSSGHVLYFYNEQLDMLVAQPTNLIRPGDVLTAWLEGPDDPDLIGLPADIDVLGVELAANELLTLEFTFRDSLRDFAVDHPESVRRVLEGLIATFNTGFPDVGGVLLDFEGHNALGLGQCANLLNTVQGVPEVLNDERLLSRYAGS